MRIDTDLNRKEIEIIVGDFMISINHTGQIEVWDSVEKKYRYEGTLDQLFKSPAEQKMIKQAL